MSSPGDIESRLAVLEAERAILKHLHGYGHAIDYGDEERYLDLLHRGRRSIRRATAGSGDVTRVVAGAGPRRLRGALLAAAGGLAQAPLSSR